MSVIKLYQCDICRKKLDKCCLYRFKLAERVLNGDFAEDVEYKFDICKKCHKKIVKEIRKEDKAGGRDD